MAEHLDRHQLAEIGSFLNELAAFAGYDSTAQWARGVGKVHARPDGVATLVTFGVSVTLPE